MHGPMIYCLEGVDHTFGVLDMCLPQDAEIHTQHRPDLLGGVTVLQGQGRNPDDEPVEFTSVPYYAWQNRGIAEMTVWLIEDRDLPAEDGGQAGPLAEPSQNIDG